MTKEAYMQFHAECATKMVEITKKKNSDYTGTSDDPFANFRKRGEFGFLVRMDDKLARLESFIQKGSYQVADESFEDTCIDLANYSILLAGYVRARKAEKASTQLTFEQVGDVSGALKALNETPK